MSHQPVLSVVLLTLPVLLTPSALPAPTSFVPITPEVGVGGAVTGAVALLAG